MTIKNTMGIYIPGPGDVLKYLNGRESIQRKFDKAIQMSDDLNYVMDLCGLEFSPSSYGTKIQSWLSAKYGWGNITQSLNMGDFNTPSSKNIELKCSIIKKGERANLLNLRLDTPVNNYLFIIRSMRKNLTKIFFVPADNVKYMVDTFKEGSYDKHNGTHANIRVNIDSIVWDDDPDMNLWSNLHQFEITEQDLTTI